MFVKYLSSSSFANWILCCVLGSVNHPLTTTIVNCLIRFCRAFVSYFFSSPSLCLSSWSHRQSLYCVYRTLVVYWHTSAQSYQCLQLRKFFLCLLLLESLLCAPSILASIHQGSPLSKLITEPQIVVKTVASFSQITKSAFSSPIFCLISNFWLLSVFSCVWW